MSRPMLSIVATRPDTMLGSARLLVHQHVHHAGGAMARIIARPLVEHLWQPHGSVVMKCHRLGDQ
jgi:hypothetical protein